MPKKSQGRFHPELTDLRALATAGAIDHICKLIDSLFEGTTTGSPDLPIQQYLRQGLLLRIYVVNPQPGQHGRPASIQIDTPWGARCYRGPLPMTIRQLEGWLRKRGVLLERRTRANGVGWYEVTRVKEIKMLKPIDGRRPYETHGKGLEAFRKALKELARRT